MPLIAQASSLLITVLVFTGAKELYKRLPSPLLLPIAVTPIILAVALILAKADYATYIAGAGWLTKLLGPATVAMAIPLYRNWSKLKAHAWEILAGALAGTIWGGFSGILMGRALRLDPKVVLTLAPRSITTPIALGIARDIGANPALTAVFVIATGVLGACAGPWLAKVLGLQSPCSKGVMFGIGSHGVGTARAMEIDGTTGAFSSISMTLAGVLGVLVIPAICMALGVTA